ncbi:preprotein translocase subunit SecG [Bacteroidota bacterium]
MYILFSVLIIIACILLVLIVLVQNSKGGGLAANFSSQNQIMGVRKTTDFLEKATWTLAVSILVLALLASMTIPRESANPSESVIEDQIQNAPNPGELGNFPTSIPTEQPSE